MDTAEAREIITTHLAPYRGQTCEQLCALIDGSPSNVEVIGASGVRYQVEISAMWDAKPHGNVRVSGCIDDWGWRAFPPLCEDFIKAPDGSFVGE